ncbi:MAG: helix-hairpin-helix domain-containing protein [Lachnospiraceae bacterium]
MKTFIKKCRKAAVLLPLLLLALYLSTGCDSRKEEMILNAENQAEDCTQDMLETESGKMETVKESLKPAVLLVHVCGAVKSPGVYELSEGDRILDAVGAAGGFSEEAAKDALNLAQLLEDSMKIQIPTREEAQTLSQIPFSEEEGKVNLNTAGISELTALGGIGESRAQDIITYRQEHGPFESIEEIKQVPGIKDAVFEKIKDKITV